MWESGVQWSVVRAMLLVHLRDTESRIGCKCCLNVLVVAKCVSYGRMVISYECIEI